MTEEQTEEKGLADLLLDNNLLSIAQIELAIADQEMNDIPLDEILLVRGWITQEKLFEIAPWLKPGSGIKPPKAKPFTKPGTKTGQFSKPSLTPPAKPAPEAVAAKPAAEVETKSAAEQAATKPAAEPAANRTAASASTESKASSEPIDTATVNKALSKASQTFQKPDSKAAEDAKPAAKPVDLPKEPPVRPAGEPAVISSPVETDSVANLKAYKEVLKKILAVD